MGRRFYGLALLVATLSAAWACSSSSGGASGSGDAGADSGGGDTDAGGGTSDAGGGFEASSSDAAIAADAPDDAAPDVASKPDAGSLPLDGNWSGTPADCSTKAAKDLDVTVTMTFSETTAAFAESFSNGFQTCSTEGQGTVSNLTDSSFELDNYATGAHTCSLALFIGKPAEPISYTFMSADDTTVFIAPQGEECYLLSKR